MDQNGDGLSPIGAVPSSPWSGVVSGLPRRFVVPAVLLVGAACGGQGTMHQGATPPGDVIVVEIENHNFNDATIYTSSGKRIRLGMVGGHSSQTFRFRWTHNNLSLVVDFIAGGGFVTDELVISAGDQIQLVIEAGDHRIGQRPRP